MKHLVCHKIWGRDRYQLEPNVMMCQVSTWIQQRHSLDICTQNVSSGYYIPHVPLFIWVKNGLFLIYFQNLNWLYHISLPASPTYWICRRQCIWIMQPDLIFYTNILSCFDKIKFMPLCYFQVTIKNEEVL